MRILLVLLVGIGLAHSGFAAHHEADLIPREVLFGNPERIQGRISPDGKMMSFIAPVDGVQNVWVAPLGNFDAAKAITDDKGRGIQQHGWAANGTHIYYVQDKGGDENYRIYVANVATGEVRDLTPFEDTQARPLAGSYRHPNELLVSLNNRDPRFHDVYRANILTGELTLVEENNGFAGYSADRDLELRSAIQSTADGGLQIFKRDDDKWVEFFKIPQSDVFATDSIGFDESGENFYLVSPTGRDKAALFKVNYATGKHTVLAESDKADISSVLTDPQTGRPLAYATNYLKEDWQALDKDTERDLEMLEKKLTGNISILSQTKDNQQWVIAHESATEPLTYFVLDRKNDSLDTLFVAQPELAGLPLQEMHGIEIKARDGLTLPSYLTLPPGSDTDGDGKLDGEPVPMVLFVHGGPWARDEYGYSSAHQWLANRGYAVLSVNYRGSTGFGKRFIEASTKEFAGKMHDDLIDAVDWAIDGGITEKDKVAIMGGSYGGYATLVGLTFTPDRFACGVDIVGPSNLVTLIESFPAYWQPFLESSWYPRVGDPRTPEGKEALEARSPLFRVDDIQSPLLIGQGANDPRVTENESEQIVDAMQEKDLPVTYVVFPDEGHGFARPENRLAFFAVAESFLADNCLGGRQEPLGNALAGSSTNVPAGAQFIGGLPEALENFDAKIAQ